MAEKSQMLLRKTIQNTKTFLNKTLQNFKSFLVGDYPNKLSEAFVIKKIFCRWNGNQKISESNNFWQNTLDEVMDNAVLVQKIQDKEREQEECSESIISIPVSGTSTMSNEGEQAERKLENRQEGIQRGQSSRSIARKLKQLEMLEPKDVEHVLDVEEVLHYYSRLTSPAYVDIVDRFCTDMHNENSLQQPSVSITANNSMRRTGSLRRLGPVKL
ncbi:hypothetical protein LIER_07518 [Lithospermum erythrorhizon]|uniref:Uncharacterized protein n=1 Tax=Lithospermum erythrorhizon TaxID=34254 RepID=A0AAV3PD41_LITER